MKCPNCGNEIENGALFCDECCAKVSAQTNTESDNEVKTSPQINLYDQLSAGAQNINAQNQGSMQQNIYGQAVPNKKAKGPRVLEVISLIFGIFSIITLGCFLLPQIVAIVCGVLCKDEQGKRTKLANVGFILGIISAAFCVVLLIIGMFA